MSERSKHTYFLLASAFFLSSLLNFFFSGLTSFGGRAALHSAVRLLASVHSVKQYKTSPVNSVHKYIKMTTVHVSKTPSTISLYLFLYNECRYQLDMHLVRSKTPSMNSIWVTFLIYSSNHLYMVVREFVKIEIIWDGIPLPTAHPESAGQCVPYASSQSEKDTAPFTQFDLWLQNKTKSGNMKRDAIFSSKNNDWRKKKSS